MHIEKNLVLILFHKQSFPEMIYNHNSKYNHSINNSSNILEDDTVVYGNVPLDYNDNASFNNSGCPISTLEETV